jgi:RNA-directed DNA polymerase
MKTLLQELRSEQNVFAAWRHVKSSAIASRNDEIRGAASLFEHCHQRYLRKIVQELRAGTFQFDAATGVLKDKKARMALGKAPRPIVVTEIETRIVQRALLQVLQPRDLIDPRNRNSPLVIKRDSRLGGLNDVNVSKYGVGGLIAPHGGVEAAIRLVREQIDQGARYYFRSDIEAFFTRISKQVVVDKIFNETKDGEFAEFFSRALEVKLKNIEEIGPYEYLFPTGKEGVAQGSPLSAFAGNVLLYPLDCALNALNVTAVRYIDDILVVSADLNSLKQAVRFAKDSLNSFGMNLYEPKAGSSKAAQGLCENGIDFLGCFIQPRRCVPSSESVARFKDRIRTDLSESKGRIKDSLAANKSLDTRLSTTATLDRIFKFVYGWQKSFSFCTDASSFEHLDRYVRGQVLDYERSVRRIVNPASDERQTMVMGLPSMHNMHQRKTQYEQ